MGEAAHLRSQVHRAMTREQSAWFSHARTAAIAVAVTLFIVYRFTELKPISSGGGTAGVGVGGVTGGGSGGSAAGSIANKLLRRPPFIIVGDAADAEDATAGAETQAQETYIHRTRLSERPIIEDAIVEAESPTAVAVAAVAPANVVVAPSPAPPMDFSRTYRACIAGTWFGGTHHWARGEFRCPSGCSIIFEQKHFKAESPDIDAYLIHGMDKDLHSSGALLAHADAIRTKQLLLFYAAENFYQMQDENLLAKFNGEMSYRMASIAREIQYPLEAIGRFDHVTSTDIGDISSSPERVASPWMHRLAWRDVVTSPRVPDDRRVPLSICWASNHCISSSGREDYVRELLRHIPVEVYTAPCLKNAPEDKQNMDWNAQRDLWRTYKFYLAFENTRCDDYVTEKFYLALLRGQVPIVLGASNIALHAPSRDSYIDVRDYASPADLAAYLRYLDGNATAYAAYFDWHTRPLSTYGAALREVLEAALPVAQSDGPKDGHSGGKMFACATCHALARWQARGRPLDGTVAPFKCEGPMAPQGDGRWA